MINKTLRKEIAEINPDLVIFNNPSFDNSIIGIDVNNNHLIYDYNKMVKELMKDDNLSKMDAIEFIDYNTVRTLDYIDGAGSPIILDTASAFTNELKGK